MDNYHQNSVQNFHAKLLENKSILKQLYLSIGMDFNENTGNNSVLNEDLINSNPNFELKSKYYNCKFPFSFPNKFDIICLNNEQNTSKSNTESFLYGFDDENFKFQAFNFEDENTVNSNPKIYYLSELLKLNSSIGKLHVSKVLNKSYIENEFVNNVISESFNSPIFELKCGNLVSNINLVPTPLTTKGKFCM